jgi:hypothetical protein
VPGGVGGEVGEESIGTRTSRMRVAPWAHGTISARAKSETSPMVSERFVTAMLGAVAPAVGDAAPGGLGGELDQL